MFLLVRLMRVCFILRGGVAALKGPIREAAECNEKMLLVMLGFSGSPASTVT